MLAILLALASRCAFSILLWLIFWFTTILNLLLGLFCKPVLSLITEKCIATSIHFEIKRLDNIGQVVWQWNHLSIISKHKLLYIFSHWPLKELASKSHSWFFLHCSSSLFFSTYGIKIFSTNILYSNGFQYVWCEIPLKMFILNGNDQFSFDKSATLARNFPLSLLQKSQLFVFCLPNLLWESIFLLSKP